MEQSIGKVNARHERTTDFVFLDRFYEFERPRKPRLIAEESL